MSKAIYLNNIIEVKTAIKETIKDKKNSLDLVLNANALECAGYAKNLAPTDEGILKGSISADTSTFLRKSVSANVFYAAYVEFGTGKYAANYVASLPNEWKEFAAQFKGSKSGDYYDFLNNILDWVKRKGFADTYSVESKKRGSRKSKSYSDRLVSIAEHLAFYILINGIKPKPFLYPAYVTQRGQLLKDIENI